jgi:hypothetical protein
LAFEIEANDFIEKIFTSVVRRLNVEHLPEYAKEDGQDIINEFKDNLGDCKEELDRTHWINVFRVCVHKQIEVAENRIWDFKNSLMPSNSNSLALYFKLLIPLIVGFPCLIF